MGTHSQNESDTGIYKEHALGVGQLIDDKHALWNQSHDDEDQNLPIGFNILRL